MIIQWAVSTIIPGGVSVQIKLAFSPCKQETLGIHGDLPANDLVTISECVWEVAMNTVDQ